MRRELLDMRNGLIHEIATAKISDLDSATLMELSAEQGVDLDAMIESLERAERARLRKCHTDRLWQMFEDLGA
jgi:hypothetical protein